jgi:hypothetical protein
MRIVSMEGFKALLESQVEVTFLFKQSLHWTALPGRLSLMRDGL